MDRSLIPALNRESLRPAYVLVGDEIFFRDRFRQALTALLVPQELREYSIFDEDLASTPLDDILNRARNASLMAPVQIFFIRNAKELFGRGGAGEESRGSATKPAAKSGGSRRKHGAFPENLEAYLVDPNPSSVLVFIADHIHIPVDQRRISLDDKTRLRRIEETLGRCCEMMLCARVPERQAVELIREVVDVQGMSIDAAAAELMVELLNGDMGLINAELMKLSDYARPRGRITRADVEQLVHHAQQRSAYDLARLISTRSRAGALEALDYIWNAEGDGAAIGLVFQLARAFKMALILRERRVRDRSQLYAVLPEGLKPPAFAADELLSLAQRMPERLLARGIELLQRVDVWLRSSPPSPRLLLEQVILELTVAPEQMNPWRQQQLLVEAGG